MNRKAPKKYMKKLSSKVLILLQVFLLLFIVGVKADYNEFLKQLDTMGIDTKQVSNSDKISRYDLAKLLNTVECKDCINTPKDMIEKYDNRFRDAFMQIPGKDFGDINYRGGLYKGEIYYYCVAYVGDNEYMRGYPLATSPVCGGKFCGEKETTQSEFYQVIINLSAKYIFNRFSVDWDMVKNWMDKIKSGSYADKYLNSLDRKYIDENSAVNKSGYLDDVKYFSTYMKYCMFNIKSCGFQEIGNIKQAVWPVAELNVLLNQSIIDLPIAQKVDVNKLADGETVLQVLYKLYNVVQCDFNNDYDCDGIVNDDDNCPNAYNPHQVNTDKDTIGDVCDDDIDGDGIKNPIGIVDDNGRVNVGLWTDQTDSSLWGNNTGNTEKIGIYIDAGKIIGNAPLNVQLGAVTKGKINDIERDFGDGNREKGQKINHVFLYPGMYRIRATAYGDGIQADAKISLLVGENPADQCGMQIQTNRIGSERTNFEVEFGVIDAGAIDKIKRDFGDGVILQKKASEKFKRILKKNGTYTVVAKGYKGDTLKAVASVNIGAGENNIGANLYVNTLLPEVSQKIVIQTNIRGFQKSDIETIETNWGDGAKTQGIGLLYNHTYYIGGARTISQKIILKNGKSLLNFLTIYIIDPNLAHSYTYLIAADKLLANIYEKIKLSSHIIGDIFANYPLIINQYQPGDSQMFGDIKNWPQKFDYVYNKQGNRSLYSDLHVNQCITMEAQSTLGIKGNDVCLDALLNNSLSRFKCDMDKDKLPDICDDDIDGDGHKNLIGIIKYEKADCSIGPSNQTNNDGDGNNLKTQDDSNNVDVQLLKKHIGICTLDNAFPIYNPDQMDLNMNGVGDIFEDQIRIIMGDISLLRSEDSDKDGDGISDGVDLCPEIQENYNLFQDGDGCPEVGSNQQCDIRLQFPNLGGLWGGGRIDDGGGGTNNNGGGSNNGGGTNNNGGASNNGGGTNNNGGGSNNGGGTNNNGGGNNIGNGELPGGGNNIPNIPPIIQSECFQCPCNFSDITNDLSKKDAVRASLWDKLGNILYRVSDSKSIDLNMLD